MLLGRSPFFANKMLISDAIQFHSKLTQKPNYFLNTFELTLSKITKITNEPIKSTILYL